MTTVTVTVANADELRGMLDDLNDNGEDPTVTGVDSHPAPFLITLEGPYGDREEVFYGSPWSSERDWLTDVRCEDCGAHHAFGLDDIDYPATVLAVTP